MNEIEAIQSESAPNLDGTKKKIQELIRISQIKRVVVVDDEWGGSPDIEPVLGILSMMAAQDEEISFAGLSELAGIEFEAPQDVWEGPFREKWAALLFEQKVAIFQQLGLTLEENGAGHILRELFDGTSVQFLSLQEWEDRRTALINSASKERTLFLFDQDMSKGGGPADQGIRTITDLLTGSGLPEGDVFLALFSNSISGNREYEILEQLEIGRAHV